MARWALIASLVASAAFAQAGRSEAKSQIKEYTYDPDVVEGTLRGPDLGTIVAPVRVKHESLIKVREDFRQKVLNSVGEF